MKKFLVVGMVCLLILSMSTMALAQVFTHPELGEEVTASAKAVTVYDANVYTELPLSQTPLAGSGKTDIVNATYIVCQAYDQMVANGEMKSAGIDKLETVFKGGMWPQVKALPLEAQGMALLVALGFYDMVLDMINSGDILFDQATLDLFKMINDNPSKYVNVQQLQKNFPVTTVNVNGEDVPYVAFSLKLVENDNSARLEQYGFAMTDGLWPVNKVTTAVA